MIFRFPITSPLPARERGEEAGDEGTEDGEPGEGRCTGLHEAKKAEGKGQRR